jgi:hypothetical protein
MTKTKCDECEGDLKLLDEVMDNPDCDCGDLVCTNCDAEYDKNGNQTAQGGTP